MPIKNWPKEDRPREKLLNKGEQFLTDAELLAIIFKTGMRGKTAVDIAKELLTEYGNLKKILAVSPSTLMQKPGIGQAKYIALRAALELGQRYHREELIRGEILNNSALTQKFLATHMKNHANEVFACIFLDNHFRFICFEELFYGTIDSANVYPREIVRRAIHHNAAKIILAHNHPSGFATPSEADKEVTELIQQALAFIDVNITDHIIIGHTENFSFAEMGLL
ncbi:MAG: hypothetical protein A3F13_09575 [Gammaproteobacteria bacterium RIFCSPHIGHO2_12_FULL_40_19]|nr:MAG: hypothetical protein A3F13_09575 [Gammaproteobacteria bacterium RIFCSPHIGHO2_12_FULL_40_19]